MESLLPKDYYKNLIEHLPNAYAYHKIVLDEQGKPIDYIYLDINQAFEKITGVSRKEIINNRYTEVIAKPMDGGFDWISTYGEVAMTGKRIELKEYSQDLNRWYNIIAYSNEPGYFTTIFNDITEEKETEEKLKLKQVELDTFFTSNLDLLCIANKKGEFLRLNPEWENTLEYSIEELKGKNILDYVHPDDYELTSNMINQDNDKSIIKQFSNRCKSKSGKYKYIEWRIKSIEDLIYISAREVTKQKEIELEKERKQKEIEYLSFHDHLTKLYNRRFFETELKRLDTKRNLPLTIIIGDVNGLKLLNDSFGHAVGDELLIKIAQILKKVCRADDIIVRIGGDEFAILLPQTTEDVAKKIIERIHKKCAEESINGVEISIALGYATKTYKEYKIQKILKEAEDIMYENKLTEGTCVKNHTMDQIIEIINENCQQEKINIKRICRVCKMR